MSSTKNRGFKTLMFFHRKLVKWWERQIPFLRLRESSAKHKWKSSRRFPVLDLHFKWQKFSPLCSLKIYFLEGNCDSARMMISRWNSFVAQTTVQFMSSHGKSSTSGSWYFCVWDFRSLFESDCDVLREGWATTEKRTGTEQKRAFSTWLTPKCCDISSERRYVRILCDVIKDL